MLHSTSNDLCSPPSSTCEYVKCLDFVGHRGNELNLMVNLPSDLAACGGEQCFATAAMVDYTTRLVTIIQRADAKRPISSGFSAPRAAAYHQEHCPYGGKCKFAGGYWGLDTQAQWLEMLAEQNAAVDVVSVHLGISAWQLTA